MIDKREILEAASALKLLPGIVEKDYVLGWILAGINAHEEISESWVFKGGTCLKKCYFETYRFSEDLDFTLREESHIDEEFLRPVLEEVAVWVQCPLLIPLHPIAKPLSQCGTTCWGISFPSFRRLTISGTRSLKSSPGS